MGRADAVAEGTGEAIGDEGSGPGGGLQARKEDLDFSGESGTLAQP
jgi:hypothetical protein